MKHENSGPRCFRFAWIQFRVVNADTINVVNVVSDGDFSYVHGDFRTEPLGDGLARQLAPIAFQPRTESKRVAFAWRRLDAYERLCSFLYPIE
jgi:hypothetical protein